MACCFEQAARCLESEPGIASLISCEDVRGQNAERVNCRSIGEGDWHCEVGSSIAQTDVVDLDICNGDAGGLGFCRFGVLPPLIGSVTN